MESIHKEHEFEPRVTDFFDNSSEESSAHELSPDELLPDADLFELTFSTAKRRQRNKPEEHQVLSRSEEQRSIQDAEAEGYQRLSPDPTQTTSEFVHSPSSSYDGSVDKLLPGVLRNSPQQTPRLANLCSGRKKCPSSGIEQPTLSPSRTAARLLEAHAVAHEITLQALMRNENAINQRLHTFAPMCPGNRISILNQPPSMVANDPQSSHARSYSAPAIKRLHVLPPPIDTSGARHSLPSNMPRTPYPFIGERVRRAVDANVLGPFGAPEMRSIGVGTGTPHLQSESVLTLSIRRCNNNSRSRVTTLILPASHKYSTVQADSVGGEERQFKAVDFDDAALFRQLKSAYKQMSGFSFHFSARSMTRIAVCGPSSQAANASYGWLQSPRSPQTQKPPCRSFINIFNEEKILLHYKNPSLGKDRYAHVRWAHRLAAAQDEEDAPIPSSFVCGERHNEGLEFIVGWSVQRISAALLLVIILSVASALLWTFLGHPSVLDSTESPSVGKFRHAGGQVGSGALMGIWVLLVGLIGFSGWIAISWIVL